MAISEKFGRIFLTKHCKERFKERFQHYLVQDHARQVFRPNSKDLSHKMYELIDNGYNNRSFLNNTKFMQYLYETYGTHERYEFIVSDDIVFVTKITPSSRVVVTCLEKKTVTFLKENHKFKKKEEEFQLSPVQEQAIQTEDFDDFLKDLTKTKSTKTHF